MKTFISYRFTGENPKTLKRELGIIYDALERRGHSTFHSLRDEKIFRRKKFTNRKILEYALKNLDRADGVVAFIKSDKKSEGMLIEIGYALAKKKKFILLIKKGVATTFLGEMADKVIEFTNVEELPHLLKSL